MKSNNAFSLVELMVVLSIISIVVGLAYPRYLNFKIRAARTEAFTNLNYIYTLKQSYFSENGSYGNLEGYGYRSNSTVGESCFDDKSGTRNEIGFSVTQPCQLRYSYSGINSVGGTAKASEEKYPGPTLKVGRGFGINSANCSGSIFSINSTLPVSFLKGAYSDALIIDGDRNIDIFLDGLPNIPNLEKLFDATKQCP